MPGFPSAYPSVHAACGGYVPKSMPQTSLTSLSAICRSCRAYVNVALCVVADGVVRTGSAGTGPAASLTLAVFTSK